MTDDDWDKIDYVLRHYGCGMCSSPSYDKVLRELADKLRAWREEEEK